MFSWPDVIFSLGLVALTMVAARLGLCPKEVCLGAISAALAYYVALTVLRRRQAAKLLGGKTDDVAAIPQLEEGGPHTSQRVIIEPGGRVVVEREADAPDEPLPMEITPLELPRPPAVGPRQDDHPSGDIQVLGEDDKEKKTS